MFCIQTDSQIIIYCENGPLFKTNASEVSIAFPRWRSGQRYQLAVICSLDWRVIVEALAFAWIDAVPRSKAGLSCLFFFFSSFFFYISFFWSAHFFASFFFCYIYLLAPKKHNILSKALVYHCFLVFRRIGECISLDVFCFVLALFCSCWWERTAPKAQSWGDATRVTELQSECGRGF